MTAKEEAKELLDKFYPRATSYSSDRRNQIENAKQCALIAIEFAADQFDKYCCAEMGVHWTKDDEHTDGTTDHFRYIKEEVKKL